jgi:hypothetical protein
LAFLLSYTRHYRKHIDLPQFKPETAAIILSILVCQMPNLTALRKLHDFNLDKLLCSVIHFFFFTYGNDGKTVNRKLQLLS